MPPPGKGYEMRGLLVARAVTVLAAMRVPASASLQFSGLEDFQSYPIGTIFSTSPDAPASFVNDTWGDAGSYRADARYNVVELQQYHSTNKVLHIADRFFEGATYFYSNFASSPYPSSGVYSIIFRVGAPTAHWPFKIVLTDGNGWLSPDNWVAAVGFGGKNVSSTLLPGMGPGNVMGLQVTPTQFQPTSFHYQDNNWYMLELKVDVTAKTYRLSYVEGTEITSGPQPWITGAASPPSTLGGLLIATSDTHPADVYIDNIIVTPEPSGLAILAAAFGSMIAGIRRARKA